LDLFGDLQESLQPRFHLEIGLLKMVQAGKLIPIEEALASIGSQVTPQAATARPPSAAPDVKRPPVRTGPSPFELDRLKKTGAPVAEPSPLPDDDWGGRLHRAMTETGLAFSADAIAQSEVALVNNQLQITAPRQFQLDLGRD